MFSLKEESKRIKAVLFLSSAIMFSLIMISIFYYGNSNLLGDFYKPNNDDVKFIRSAWLLATTGNYTYHNPPSATVFMMPGLSFTLAFFMKIFGEFGGITAFRILQGVMQIGSLMLIFYIGRKIFNSKVAIVAVVLDLFYIAEILMPTLILTETIFKFFVLCLIFISLYAVETGKIKYYVLGGVFLALSALFRPTISLYPILILIMWIVKKEKPINCIRYACITIAVFCVMLSPWWIRNYTIFHRFIPFTIASGDPMRQGTFIDYDKSVKLTEGIDYTNYNYDNPNLSEIEKDNMQTKFSKYRLSILFPREPLRFVYWYTIGKGWIQIKTPFYWKEMLGVTFSQSKEYHSLLLILAFIGCIAYFRNRDRNKLGLLPFMALIYFIIVYLPFYTMSRYYYPIMPCLIIFSANIILLAYEHLKKNLIPRLQKR
ncbi:glycosyltransferase family 39 protein [Clostridium sp. 19966]|uniref:ArnT family glycosyltransferase n=1 Tax=Clostridium sp. 19966 TaxID=2768166 RepID=UPI0028DF0653|nr:glycosyltransferase family 39 protein [Clostridium sp. 19966]MDT8717206.1 glycosyltransferase family 39 protein [Clostridium sp. 19966]